MEKQRNFLLSLYFFILFLYSAASTEYAVISESAPIYVSLFPLFLGLLVAVKQNISFTKKSFIILMGIFIIWNIIIYLTLHRPPSPYPFIDIICAYIAYHAYKNDFVDRFLKTSTFMAGISLIIWMLCLSLPPVMKAMATQWGLLSYNVSYSFFVFNISSNIGQVWPIRNSGFCWEPGRFSCFMVLSLYFYLVKYGLDFHKKSFWILLIALASSFSTTGYGMFLVLIAAWVLYKKKMNPIYIVPILIIGAVVWNLPFMHDKIMDLMVDKETAEDAIDQMVYITYHDGKETYYTPQRIQAMYLQWMNVENMPLLTGEGRNLLNHYINRVNGITISLSEGILGIFVRYGFVLGILCYYSLYKSSLYFASMNPKIPGFLFMVLFILANYSYYFWEYPLFCLMWCWYFFEDKTDRRHIQKSINKSNHYCPVKAD